MNDVLLWRFTLVMVVAWTSASLLWFGYVLGVEARHEDRH